MKRIEDAIGQKKFIDNKHKAHINILYTSSFFESEVSRAIKSFDISPQQYNILRILKGCAPCPASVKSLTERMLDRMSNASRLVDKLRTKGLVERFECPSDRRQVNVFITEAGMEVLKGATRVMDEALQSYMTQLSEEEAGMLSDLLDKFRG